MRVKSEATTSDRSADPQVATLPVSRASRRRVRTRERLLAVAEEAFTAGSYRDVRMEDLAETADVSVGSIYDHFGSKDGLYLALAERALGQFAEYLERAFDADFTPLEQVMAAGDAYLRFHLEHPGSFRFLAFDALGAGQGPVDGPLGERVGSQLEEIIGDFQGLIEAALAAGEADARFDPRLTARFLWGAWNGVVSFSLRQDRMRLSDEDIAACLQLGRRLVNDGLAAQGFRDDRGHSRARLMDTARDR